jgi:hypothetical protein
MYKSETRRYIEKALANVLAEGACLPGMSATDANEISENIGALAKVLTEQLWAEGYELEPRQLFQSSNLRDIYAS